jgi:glycosyltransferase involved in cell wall biosynthesis
MRVLYIGVYAESTTIDLINKNSNKDLSVSIAATNYTYLICEGLKNKLNYNCSNLFLVPMGMYPGCKLLFWPPKIERGNFYIPFINILIIKQITIGLFLFFYSIFWYFKQPFNEKKLVIFSSLYLPFLISISPLKLFKNLKIVSFVPDMPEYEFLYSKSRFSIKKVLIPLYIFLSKSFVSIIDYFVFITKYMVSSFPKRPYSIIEGFVNNKLDTEIDIEFLDKNSIMYSGALFEKYGIDLLLKAFIEINGDYELWLFGSGDMEDVIIKFSNLDPRIKYFGLKSHDEVLTYQKKAKLLLNPRPSNCEYTKYSFPSKLMEYLASGTPVLTTRLPGIPDDYSDKMFFIDLETVEGIKDSMLNCLSKSQVELNLFGYNAKLYVTKNKNNYRLIEDLIVNLSNSIHS